MSKEVKSEKSDGKSIPVHPFINPPSPPFVNGGQKSTTPAAPPLLKTGGELKTHPFIQGTPPQPLPEGEGHNKKKPTRKERLQKYNKEKADSKLETADFKRDEEGHIEVSVINNGKKQWYKIDKWDYTAEIGGVYLGRFLYPEYPKHLPVNEIEGATGKGVGWDLKHIVQIKNVSKDPLKYKMSKNPFIFLASLWKKMTFKDLLEGVRVIGDWHSHLNKVFAFSPEDEAGIEKQVKRHGVWLAGLLVRRNRNICRMGIKLKGSMKIRKLG